MLYIRLRRYEDTLEKTLDLLNRVNDDQILGFKPGCLRVCSIVWGPHKGMEVVNCFLDVDVSGTADRVGPFASLDPKTNRVVYRTHRCWERARFIPVFGPTPNLRLALTDEIRCSLAKV